MTPTTAVSPGSTIPGGGPAPSPGAGAGAGATTTTLGLTVGILGPPRTGVAPLTKSHFPWSALMIIAFGGATAMGLVVKRRSHFARR